MTSEYPCPIDALPIHDQAVVCEECTARLARALGDVAPSLQDLARPALTSDGKLIAAAYGARRSTPWDTRSGERGRLHQDLTVTRTGQAKTSSATAGRSTGERPVPWREAATAAQRDLATVLARWVRVVEAGRGVSPSRSDSGFVAGWLMNHLEWLRRHPDAVEAVRSIVGVVRDAARVVDVRPQCWYAGPCLEPLEGSVPCPCGCHDGGPGTACDLDREVLVNLLDGEVTADQVHGGEGCGRLHDVGLVIQCAQHLYAEPPAAYRTEDAEVACPGCGARHPVSARRRWLLAAAEDQLAHAAMLATAVTTLGQPVTAHRIRVWKSRGRILERSVDLRGRPLYRVGDVLDLLGAEAARRAVG